MKANVILHVCVVIALLSSGCAASYNRINPPLINYEAHDTADGITLSYQHNVLIKNGNKKMAKKERSRGVKVIAVKITNNSDTLLQIGKNASFYCEGLHVDLLSPDEARDYLKQSVPSYLPYLLLTFVELTITSDNSTDSYPIGYILGPGITAGNMIVAGQANTNFLHELNLFNLINKTIDRGETVYGLICVRNIPYGALKLKIE